MFLETESSIKTHLTDVISGVPVLGTYDWIDLSERDAPAVALRVSWEGFEHTAQKQDALAGRQRFAVSLTVSALRVKPAQHAQIDAGLAELYRRLITWRPNPAMPDLHANVESAVLQEAGAIWQYVINLTIPGYKIRAAE